MSDTTVAPPVAAPASAPVEAPVAPAPAAPPAAPAAPAAATPPPTPARDSRSLKSQGRSQMLERLAKQQQAHHSREQPREPAGKPEGGQFAVQDTKAEGAPETSAPPAAAGEQPPAEPQAAAAPAPAAVSTSTTSSTDGQSVAASEPPTPGTVRIPLEEGHPFRARGHTEWEAPADRENEVRAMLNAVAERSQLREQLRQQREKEALLEARLKAQSGELPYKPDPKVEHLLGDIEKTYDPETAALIRQGLEALNAQALRAAEQRALEQVNERQVAEEFVGTVAQTAAQRFPVWAESGRLDANMVSLLDQYAQRVDQRNAARKARGEKPVPPTEREFFQWAGQSYVVDPAVQDQMRQRQDAAQRQREEQIRREERERLAAEERQRLAEAANRHSVRPPATSSHASVDRTVSDPAEEARRRAMSSPNRRQVIRRSIAERFGG